MKLLKIIDEKNVGLKEWSTSRGNLYRKAARAILFDKNKNIAIIFVTKKYCHKLPGGGIDEGENFEIALRRELMEEVGAKIEITGELGLITEVGGKPEYKQDSYCYFAKVVGKLEKQSFTEEEKSSGTKLVWMKLDEAIKILENDKPTEDIWKYIRNRDLIFLKEAKKQLNL